MRGWVAEWARGRDVMAPCRAVRMRQCGEPHSHPALDETSVTDDRRLLDGSIKQLPVAIEKPRAHRCHTRACCWAAPCWLPWAASSRLAWAAAVCGLCCVSCAMPRVLCGRCLLHCAQALLCAVCCVLRALSCALHRRRGLSTVYRAVTSSQSASGTRNKQEMRARWSPWVKAEANGSRLR
jgi:hypothetical protein